MCTSMMQHVEKLLADVWSPHFLCAINHGTCCSVVYKNILLKQSFHIRYVAVARSTPTSFFVSLHVCSVLCHVNCCFNPFTANPVKALHFAILV